jgi:FkbM family methyltransferase
MSFLRRIEKCPPKGQGTVLDIGANNGVISIGMLVADEINRAIAIEPDPRNFSLLQRNIELNHLEEKVVCLNYAVSDTKSELDFELSEDNYGDHRIRRGAPDSRARELFAESRRRVIEVQADRLDSLIDNLPSLSKEEISVIWIDVQGYEGFVFLGATDVLSQDIPVVAEIWPYGIQRAGMSQETFCEIAGEIWSSYWVMDGEGILEYSVEELDWLFKELGYDGDFTNVIFTR